MKFVSRPWLVRGFSICFLVIRNFCQWSSNDGRRDEDLDRIDEPLKLMPKNSDYDLILNERLNFDGQDRYPPRRSFIETVRFDAGRILEVLRQDGPGFDTTLALNDLGIRVSGLIVREVLFGILKSVNNANKRRCAQLGYGFFTWSCQLGNYRHDANSYHLLMKIFANCREIVAMFSLADEMIEKGFHVTARTFIILICACGKARWPMKFVKLFIKSRAFKHSLSKHTYNAILYCLLSVNQYNLILIEWVYQQMLADDHTPDTFTCNIVLCSKCRLRNYDQFYQMIAEMPENGLCYDLHTYNIILHVHGKSNNSYAAQELLNEMKKVGHHPSVLHFSTLIDGFGKARNIDMSEFFFNEMIKDGCMPDVVCYNVMITGYVFAGEFSKAQRMFDEMILKGQLTNAFTYNAIIRGFCMSGKFQEAFSILSDMESRSCNPNLTVYNTLERNL